jgi:Zn-dependent peptidase ImmA (M78 family)/transcriptional regulator with XRE-family HTH domain
MIGERLTQLRLAQNLTLDSLSEKMGGIVTKQALSKYEQNQAQPSPLVLTKLSAALGVKANFLLTPLEIQVKFLAYRSATSLPERERQRVKSVITQCLEDRIWVQTMVGQSHPNAIPWQKLQVTSLEDTETQANYMRKLWDLGSSSISDVTGTLEEHQICVLSIEADEKFDGMSALAYDSSGDVMAGAIVSRRDVPGERQRLNITHELGHLVLNISPNVDEEKAAFRFGSAFLAPAEQLFKSIGIKRSYINISELLILKKQFGISIQALLHRMLELGIINDTYYKRWCIFINKTGWKKQEPDEFVPEKPQWFTRNLSRLVGEGAITKEEAERVLGESIDMNKQLKLSPRQAFLKLPIEQRRLLLEKQVKSLEDYYENEVEDLTTEDGIIDY